MPDSTWEPPPPTPIAILDAGNVDNGAASGAGGISAPIFQPPSTPIGRNDVLREEARRAQPIARILYSWTTDEQYQELRRDDVLLTRTERPALGGGLVRQVLSELASSGDALATALTGPEFQKARYAWPKPWATLQGWPNERYGNKLIQIELREDAWIAMIGESKWHVFDLQGNEVPLADVVASPARVGAVYHFHLGDDLSCSGSFVRGGAGSFREYFLPNPAMIARWSLATEEMRDRLVSDIAMLENLRDWLDLNPSEQFSSMTTIACQWHFADGSDPSSPAEDYINGLAFASPRYALTLGDLDALIRALRAALFDPDPFVHEGP